MLTIVASAYIGGVVFVALMFVICAWEIRSHKDEPAIGSFREGSLLSWWLSIAPEYIFLWPWRCVGFPAYALIQAKRNNRKDHE